MRLAPLEAVLNRNIAASSAARTAARRLADKTLAVKFVGAPESTLVTLYFHCTDERIDIDTQREGACDATLSGTPLAYLSMIRQPPEDAMRSGSIRIEGDAEVAQAFRDLLQAAQPDFEEELSRVIGDVSAHQVGNMARGVIQFGKRVANTFAQNVSEYLQEESRDVVTRIEADEFNEAVDKLRDDAERTEARLRQLEHNAVKN